MGESAPFWRFSAASYPDLEVAMSANTVAGTTKKTSNGESMSMAEVCNFSGLCLFLCSNI